MSKWSLGATLRRGYSYSSSSSSPSASRVRDGGPMPVITVPKYLEPLIKKHRNEAQKKAENIHRLKASQGNRKLPVIVSKSNPGITYYFGQTYPSARPVPLASLGWKKAKYLSDEITFRAYADDPFFNEAKKHDRNRQKRDHEEGNETRVGFAELGLKGTLCDGLEAMGMKRPTVIQEEAIPQILSTNNVLCSAETGSGKTVAYVAPLIDMIRRHKDRFGESTEKNPRGLVIVPGRELAEQVGRVAQNLGIYSGVGVAVMVGGAPKHLNHSGYDLVVTTIGLVLEHIRRSVYSLKNVGHLVLDEADTLLDDSFNFNVLDLLHNLKFKDVEDSLGAQIILVSATVPSNLEEAMGNYIDMGSVQKVTTGSLHHILPHIKQTFIRLEKYERDPKLLRLVSDDVEKGRPVMIFSNRTKMSNWISHFLTDNGIQCLRLNKSVDDEERLDQFDRFQGGECDVISCTDLGSRGLDTTRTQHVINFECPHYVSDYLHRAGRTGRVGSHAKCSVTSFVSFKPDVMMLQKLEHAVRKSVPIQKVDANIKSQLKKHWQGKRERLTGS